jgi:hypothetical protein
VKSLPLLGPWCLIGLVPWLAALGAAEPENLIRNPSFEQTKPADQFGFVFPDWGGWKYEGECEYRVGRVARRGQTSALLFGASAPKIRLAQTHPILEPGRYRITAYLRGLDISTGVWNATTEFACDGQYFQLQKNGTFGWTPLTYVFQVQERKQDFYGPAFGLMAPGYLWVDDVEMVKVPNDVPLTDKPVLGTEEEPLAPPGELGPDAVRCPQCGYRNQAAWKTCFACGAKLDLPAVAQGPAVKPLASFEDKSPFSAGQLVEQHASDGKKSLRLDKSYTTWLAPQDWSGYDYLKADLYTDAARPLDLYVEIRDQATRDYWTRVNYNTVVPPGRSTLVLPLDQLYVGEKSRPGRKLMLSGVTHLVFSVGDQPPAPLYLDNLRLDRDVETPPLKFDGLHAFDLGTSQSPLMPGFTRVDPATIYSRGRGYGLQDARLWRTFDALQPDPLYQDFLCIEQGGLAVDVPNGTYRVFVNLDSPSGFWGEYQVYQTRAVLAEGREAVRDQMTFDTLKQKYFRFWDVEDSPEDDTFDKYQRAYFQEKEFDVTVTDGQLNLEFRGQNWACCVSAVVIYPADRAAEGRRFLDGVVAKRRFYFDNYFHRVLHKPTGDEVQPTAEDQQRGYVVFTRDYMQDVFYNDRPSREELGRGVSGFGMANELEPLTLSIYPLTDLGSVTVTPHDLTGPGTIPAACLRPGFVSNRVSRVTMEGTVYTIEPRLVMPRDTVVVRQGVTRRFWLTICPPPDTPPGLYRGAITVRPEQGRPLDVPVEYRVYRGQLDPVDIPVGPWGHEIGIPWDGSDPAARTWTETMASRSLERLRQYGLTTCSGLPRIRYLGFRDGQPTFDFRAGDEQMQRLKAAGFAMPVVSYVHLDGLNLYYKDEAAMRAAGFDDYSRFIRTVFAAIQSHADAAGWLPVYWNLGDEPIGDDLRRAAENAEAYRAAVPVGPPFFTAATSFTGDKADDPHFRFARALHVANLNLHDEACVGLLRGAGAGWAFYNGGNRWTYGTYMYKAAKEFDMKFRLSWHWNVVAGDPYYALDCREDDYAWCNASPNGELIPSLHFEREIREGVDDYRYLLTLARLADQKQDVAAKALIRGRLDAFRLGQRDHDALFPASDWRDFRRQLAEAIERLR